MNGIIEMVKVIEELRSYNKLSLWQKIQNRFRPWFKLKPIENIVINPEREKVLKKRIAKLKKRIDGTKKNNN